MKEGFPQGLYKVMGVSNKIFKRKSAGGDKYGYSDC